MLPRLPSKKVLFSLGALGCVLAAIAADEVNDHRPAKRHTAAAAQPAAVAQATEAAPASSVSVERGRYLVTIIGCNDCHTPFKMGPNGPEPDMTRMLSGHPQNVKVT